MTVEGHDPRPFLGVAAIGNGENAAACHVDFEAPDRGVMARVRENEGHRRPAFFQMIGHDSSPITTGCAPVWGVL